MGVLELGVLIAIIVGMGIQLNKNRKEIASMKKQLTEIDVRIAARIEDRLTVIEQDMENMEKQVNILKPFDMDDAK